MTAFWILSAFLVLWWPSHVVGPLDGAPLDTAADAVLLGLLFPTLCWLSPSFFQDKRARALLLAILAWKSFGIVSLAQDGWCVSLNPSKPYVRDGTGRPHSWDVRADWMSGDPKCSAIANRSFMHFFEFPVWFFNLPADDGKTPHPGDVPPAATTAMTLTGDLHTSTAGTFQLMTSPDITAVARIDGQPVPADGAALAPGSHPVVVEAVLTGERWQFQPLWNGADLWGRVTTTVTPASALDRAVRPWARWITAMLVSALLVGWTLSALAPFADAWTVGWMAAASAGLALAAWWVPERRWHYVFVSLLACCALPLPERVKNLRGVFLLVGVPWLVFDVVVNVFDQGFGRFTLHSPGDDWWGFQRYAYRIFMQGYWLEGGEHTFWFQPMYRWFAGAIHMVFGDPDLGQDYWDGAGVVMMALFAFQAVRALAGFRWALGAASLTLISFMAGPGFIFVGRGLSEITSAGFIYLAALLAMRSRDGSWRMALGAGIFATLGVWTRLNNLPMALGVMAFAWPLDEPVRILWHPTQWFKRVSKPALVLLPATVAVGLALFAWRTWFYTGTFSIFLGTQSALLSLWRPEMSVTGRASAVVSSVMMVLTTTDPPSYHNGAVPVIAGAVLSAAALSGIGLLGRLPFALVGFCLSCLVGAVVARGTAYTGRFSIHLIGASVAVLTCTLWLASEARRRVRVRDG